MYVTVCMYGVCTLTECCCGLLLHSYRFKKTILKHNSFLKVVNNHAWVGVKRLFYVNNSSVHAFLWAAIQTLIHLPENTCTAPRTVHVCRSGS